MPSNSKFTKNDNGDTSVRVVSSTQSVVDTNQDSVFCKDEGGNVAIRVVTAQESLPAEQPDSMFTKDTHGNTAIRTVGGGGGSTPVIDELNVTPSTSAQTITAPEGTDGYNPVNVAAVTSAIDANIVAGNIKKDVEILGVTGSYEGVAPSGTKSITANGVYDVTDYASADVQVPTTAPAYYVPKTIDANNRLGSGSLPINTFSGVEGLKDYAMYGAFANGTLNSDTTLDVSSITHLGLQSFAYCFYNIGFAGYTLNIDFTNLTTITSSSVFSYWFTYALELADLRGTLNLNFSGLININSSANNCFERAFTQWGANLSCNVGFPNLKQVLANNCFSYSFYNNKALRNFSIPELTTVSGITPFVSAFDSCANLKTFSANKLDTVNSVLSPSYAPMFSRCVKLESVELGGLKSTTFAYAVNQIQYLFHTSTGSQAPNGCTIHFPSNFDPSDPNHTFDASTLAGYPTFGGNASYIHVAFDLPATE